MIAGHRTETPTEFREARGLAAGFAAASGEIVLTMDADLQDDPAEIPRFLTKLDEDSIWCQVGSSGARIPWVKPFPVASSTPLFAPSPVCPPRFQLRVQDLPC